MKFYILIITLLFSINLFAQEPSLTVQKGHSAPITSMVTSVDGRLIVSGSFDGSIRLWDALSKKELRVFESQSMGHVEVALKDKVIAGTASNGMLTVWNLETGKIIQQFDYASNLPTAIIFHPSEAQLIVGFADGKAQVLNYRNGDKSKPIQAQSSIVKSIDINFDGDYFLTAGESGLMVWNTKSLRLERQLVSTEIETARFSFDGNYIVAGGKDGLIKIFDTETMNYIAALEAHESRLVFTDISRDNGTIVSGDLYGNIKVWDTSTQDTIKTFKVGETLKKAFLHPDGRTLITGKNQNLRLWRTTTGKKITDFKGLIESWETKYVNAVKFSLDSQRIISVGGKSLRLWGEISGDKIDLDNDVEQLALHPNGRYIATLEKTGKVVLWDAVAKDTVRTFEGQTKHIYFVENGRLMLGYLGKELIIWQTSTGKMLDFVTIGEQDIFKLAIHPDESTIAVCGINGEVNIYSYRTGKFLSKCASQNHNFFALAFTNDGRQLIGGTEDGYLIIWDVKTGAFSMKIKAHEGMISALYLDDDYFVSADINGEIGIWNQYLESIAKYQGHSKIIMEIDKNKDFLITCSADNTIKLWNFNTQKNLATFYAFGEEWAIVTPESMFDASSAAMSKMHYVIGLEALELNQLKERYFEPGLLAKILKINEEKVRDVSTFQDVPLYPLAKLAWKDKEKKVLKVKLNKRNGGIGKVSLFINKKEIIEDINPKRKTEVEVNLEKYRNYLKYNNDDFFAVKTFNEAGWLSSKPERIRYVPPKGTRGTDSQNSGGTINLGGNYKPKFYSIIIGTSDYRGEKLDLSYADKDAEDMATALTEIASPLFGKANVQVNLLSTKNGLTPTKENIRKKFQAVAAVAKPGDIFIVYLSGHGVTFGEQNTQFYYLTKEIASEDISDKSIREQFTLSTAELTELLKNIPAQKQVMIIDACSSGSLVNNVLSQSRSLSSSQRRALDRMKDRTGMFILAGSAANKVSYEASQFGQGLLTYSLLLGMNGSALRDNQYVDVMQLFQFAADKVPEFAAFIGGMQRPVIATPAGSNSFDIGQFTDEVSIPMVEVKPLFVRSNFQEENDYDDILELSDALDNRLMDISAQGKSASVLFVNVKKYPNAYAIKGRYSLSGENITANIRVFKGEELVKKFTVNGSSRDIDGLVESILKKVE